MSRERCSGCGLELEGGTAACQVLFETITTREYADARYTPDSTGGGSTHRVRSTR